MKTHVLLDWSRYKLFFQNDSIYKENITHRSYIRDVVYDHSNFIEAKISIDRSWYFHRRQNSH